MVELKFVMLEHELCVWLVVAPLRVALAMASCHRQPSWLAANRYRLYFKKLLPTVLLVVPISEDHADGQPGWMPTGLGRQYCRMLVKAGQLSECAGTGVQFAALLAGDAIDK